MVCAMSHAMHSVCGPAPAQAAPTSPWDGILPERQHVDVMCGGRRCTRLSRARLWSLRPASYPQRLFKANSPFLGSVVRWSGDAWQWEVPGAKSEDVHIVMQLLSLAGAEQAVLERIVGASHPRMRHFACEWGLM